MALKALEDLKRDAELGLAPGRQSVSDVLDQFMAHGTAQRTWAPATIRSYGSAIETHLRPALGRRPLRDLSVQDVDRLIQKMVAAGQSARNVGHVRAVLRAALHHAERQGLVARNVASLASAPAVRRKEMRALSLTDIAALFSALDGHRLRALFVTAATLGLRRGELIALRWSDVNLEERTLTVRRTGSRLGGQYVEGHPKSERSRRALSLPAALSAELRKHRAEVGKERLRWGSEWHDEDRVFPGDRGGPLGQTTVRKALDAALERAHLPHIRVHDLRHTAATALLNAGGSLRDVQEMLGHSSYSLTADVYAHVLDEQRKATAERIDAALGQAIRTS